MDQEHPFTWRPDQPAILLLCGRWYVRSSLSDRDLADMISARGWPVDHTTLYRWGPRYAPALEPRVRAQLRPTHAPWRIDETSVKGRGAWMDLYRAVAAAGHPSDFGLRPHL